MNSLFDKYSSLWPDGSKSALRPILSQVQCILIPHERVLLREVKRPSHTVVILDGANLKDVLELSKMGFEQFIQASRPDFAQELLAASLMIVRPSAFKQNPLPFFFGGFQPQAQQETEQNLKIAFLGTKDKRYILERLNTFLSQNQKLEGLQDLCVQVADELITNALFGAPIDREGRRIYQNTKRDAEILLPETHTASFFSHFSEYRVVVGCVDRYGSLSKDFLMDHLKAFVEPSQVAPRQGHGGAGIGFKYMIENSANFYVYVEKDFSTLVACGFLLQGLRANLGAQKHLHFGFG